MDEEHESCSLWAVEGLNIPEFCELDPSFRAIRPFLIALPLAGIKNVGVPLRFVVGRSESEQMIAIFAEVLIARGLDPKRLRELPLLSEEGAALLLDHKLDHLFHEARQALVGSPWISHTRCDAFPTAVVHTNGIS
jgi:hypothetical protein